jgi:hypothetical protein
VKDPIQRQSDHIHPTDKGGAVWADAFWAWLQEQRAPPDPAPPLYGKPPRSSPWQLLPASPEEHQPRSL